MTKLDKDIIKAWKLYKTKKDISQKHILMQHYIWLVKYVISQMNLPNNSILEESDFLSIGILGLHDAIEKFDIHRGIKFESYAASRIKGTIQDEMRKLDWLSRTARKKAHQFLKVGDELRNQVGREVSVEEIRKKLNVSPEEYHSYLTAAAAAKSHMTITEATILMNENDKDYLNNIPDHSIDSTIELIENEEKISFINNYLKNLNERKRLVVTLYYYESLTFKEIGTILNISESRVCQIHSQVLEELRNKLYELDNA